MILGVVRGGAPAVLEAEAWTRGISYEFWFIAKKSPILEFVVVSFWICTRGDWRLFIKRVIITMCHPQIQALNKMVMGL